MEIHVHTDKNVKGIQELIADVEGEIGTGLDAFRDRIVRVNVHLADESAAHRGASDIRCMVEVRSAGQEPVAVTHHAATTDQAVTGATRQMHDLLESRFARMNERHAGAATIRKHQG